MTALLRNSILVVATCLVAACSRTPVAPASSVAANGGNQPNTQASTDASGFTLPNFNFTPAAGQGFTITLPGHGTQGYAWHLTADFAANVVAPVGDVRLGAPPASGALGASASENFDFKAAGSGHTSLHFTLYRSWEGPSKASDSQAFNVTVN